MTASYYLVPVIGTGTRADPFTVSHAATIARFWSGSMIMGLEPFALVMVRDIDQSAIDELNADVDVVAVPPLNVTVTAGALATVKANLEKCNIPAGWVTAGMPYSTIVRACAAYIQLHQRYQGLNAARLLGAGVTLDTRINQLSANVQTKMANLADSFGFDRTGIVGTTTLRNALKQLIDQWAGALLIGGESI